MLCVFFFLSFERVGSELVVFAFFVYQCFVLTVAVTYGWICCCCYHILRWEMF
jgi:hypothetical protein